RLCDKHNALLIVDEVQTGMGRTGRMFGFEHYGIQPDTIAIAKAMGGGFPICGILCRPPLAPAMQAGGTCSTSQVTAAGLLSGPPVAPAMPAGAHGITFGGNSLACAAATAAINALKDEKLVRSAAAKGHFLIELLQDKTANLPQVIDIRGKGLMVGVELSFEGRTVVTEMLHRGVLSNYTQGNVIRLVPPLTISKTELATLVEVLTNAIRKTSPSQATN